MKDNSKEMYTKYPLLNILIYNGATIFHYSLGGIGIILGYGGWAGYLGGILYVMFAFGEMYLHMPLKVCPNCVYYKLNNSICISGLNLVSRKIAVEGDIGHFSERAKGILCPNNLYIASLIIPIIAIIPALIINFSVLLLVLFFCIMSLLAFRFFIIFPKVACVHCRAQNICPQAQQMGFKNNQ